MLLFFVSLNNLKSPVIYFIRREKCIDIVIVIVSVAIMTYATLLAAIFVQTAQLLAFLLGKKIVAVQKT